MDKPPRGLVGVVCLLGLGLVASTAFGSQAPKPNPQPTATQPSTQTTTEAAPPQDSVETEDSDEEESIPVPADLVDPDETPQTPAAPAEPAPQAPSDPGPEPSAPAESSPQTSQPATPAKSETGPAMTPSAPAGPPGYNEILIREFSGSWAGGPLMFHWLVSHSGGCQLTYSGGKLNIAIDRIPSDNSHPDMRAVSDFPVKGGKALLVCRGIAPDLAVVSKEITIGSAPVSTIKVTVRTQPKRKGLKAKGKKPKATKVVLPVAPSEVSGSYQGWCGVRPDGTWGFSQASLPGGAPAMYTPGVGLHCDVGRVSKSQWKVYICKYFHCVDPMKRKK